MSHVCTFYLPDVDLLGIGQNVLATAREPGHIQYPSKMELFDATSCKPPILKKKITISRFMRKL